MKSDDTKPAVLSAAKIEAIRFSDRHYGGTPDEGATAALGRRATPAGREAARHAAR